MHLKAISVAKTCHIMFIYPDWSGLRLPWQMSPSMTSWFVPIRDDTISWTLGIMVKNFFSFFTRIICLLFTNNIVHFNIPSHKSQSRNFSMSQPTPKTMSEQCPRPWRFSNISKIYNTNIFFKSLTSGSLHLGLLII